jgi:hypothetical protein
MHQVRADVHPFGLGRRPRSNILVSLKLIRVTQDALWPLFLIFR